MATTMLTGQYLAPDRIEAVSAGVPVIADGEALVKVEACGICGSDLSIVAGTHPRAKAPLTIGHECVGRVEAIAAGPSGIQAGDRVVLYPLLSCGNCFVCRSGQPHVCRTLRLYGFDCAGGMAEYVKVRSDRLIRIPDSLSLQAAGLIEPLAVAVHAVSRAAIQPSDSVAVIGAGPIGLLVALVLRSRKVGHIFIGEPIEFRRNLAEHLGFEVVDPMDTDFTRYVQDRTGGEGADLVFECAGAAAGALQMTELVRCRGTIVDVGVHKGAPPVDLRSINFKELTVIGSRVYAQEDFRAAIELAPHLPLGELVTHEFPLAAIADAFRIFKAGDGVCKVLVRNTI